MFPDVASVFADPIEKHAEYLLPLATVELSIIDPGLSGCVHFVVPSEPEDGLLGEETEEYHNYYVGENCIAFKLDDQGKYTFMADFKYFEYEKYQQEDPEDECGMIAEYAELYNEDRISYNDTKKHFLEHGTLNKDRDMFRHLGGQGWYGMGNAWNFHDIPTERIEGVDEEGDEAFDDLPISESGNRFINIGCLNANHYTNLAADVVLFYEPKEKIALISFIWS